MLSKNKKGFSVPIKNWINYELKDEFDKYLNINLLNKLPNFSYENFLIKLKSHRDEENDYSIEIWKIYSLVKWLKLNKLI